MILCQISVPILYSVSMSIFTLMVLGLGFFIKKWMADEEKSRDKLSDSIDKLDASFEKFGELFMEFRDEMKELRFADKTEFNTLKFQVNQLQKEHEERTCKDHKKPV